MIRYVLAVAVLLAPFAVQAQQAGHAHPATMNHGTHGSMTTSGGSPSARPTEPGQGAFAAIQEIVSILEANPDTDWSKVDIEALRRHLVDMSNVTLYAQAVASPVENGIRFSVSGVGPVRESIRRMVKAHAATMNGRHGWTFIAQEQPKGASLTVTVADRADLAKVKALGFIGIMAYGMHHQEHHLMIASGKAPHG